MKMCACLMQKYGLICCSCLLLYFYDLDGKTVVIAGLDGNYLSVCCRRSFGSVLDIYTPCYSITKPTTRCELCGKRAFFTLRKIGETDEIDWWFGYLYARVFPALCQWTRSCGSSTKCSKTLKQSLERLSYGRSYSCLDTSTYILILFLGSMYLNQLSEKHVELGYSMLLYCLAFAYVANVTITNYYEYLALKDH
ncbi:hypothetical protein RHSIM_Rhsim09G0011100 [Rhododendron simsii]|uniref:Thymidine kinase n=1 Tax=Rhododendron simsii TaxID=118357 RepID=A0A834LFE3_RHOSS|nr:hypothetical protein RHSIM_Rhsim09G0011100 [Rhododendron simsii]